MTPERIWIWFADNGNIRKWSTEPFEEGAEFATTRSALPVGVRKPEVRWPKAGDKMRFLNKNGYDMEREAAAKVFDTDATYTVKSVSIGSWSSSIYFEEVDKGWNSVMFDFVSALTASPAIDEIERVLEQIAEFPNPPTVSQERARNLLLKLKERR